MSESRSLEGFEDAMRALLAWSETSRVPMLIIGGVAVSLLRKPRTTKDIDVDGCCASEPSNGLSLFQARLWTRMERRRLARRNS